MHQIVNLWVTTKIISWQKFYEITKLLKQLELIKDLKKETFETLRMYEYWNAMADQWSRWLEVFHFFFWQTLFKMVDTLSRSFRCQYCCTDDHSKRILILSTIDAIHNAELLM